MKINKKIQILSFLLTLIPCIAYGICYQTLPAELPTHWDISGNVDGYTSKNGFVFMTLLPFSIWLMFMVLPKIDPKKENYEKFSGFYQGFHVIMILFLDVVVLFSMVASYLESSHWVSQVIFFAVGLLMLLIGNYMPKVKPNFFVGIKTPWTLSSETVWIKTHRQGGYLFIFLGLVLCLCPFLGDMTAPLLFLSILVTTIYPLAISYHFFRQEEKSKQM